MRHPKNQRQPITPARVSRGDGLLEVVLLLSNQPERNLSGMSSRLRFEASRVVTNYRPQYTRAVRQIMIAIPTLMTKIWSRVFHHVDVLLGRVKGPSPPVRRLISSPATLRIGQMHNQQHPEDHPQREITSYRRLCRTSLAVSFQIPFPIPFLMSHILPSPKRQPLPDPPTCPDTGVTGATGATRVPSKDDSPNTLTWFRCFLFPILARLFHLADPRASSRRIVYIESRAVLIETRWTTCSMNFPMMSTFINGN
jgi:hypothetical protein